MKHPEFLCAAAWLVNFPSVAHGRLAIRGRSSVIPCLEKPGLLSTLCLLLELALPARWGAGGSVVPHIHLTYSVCAIIYFVFTVDSLITHTPFLHRRGCSL